jgi:hypothetical protein
MLSCSKLEHDVMASENPSKPTVSPRKQADDRSRPQPSPVGGAPLVHSGLETVRDSHC